MIFYPQSNVTSICSYNTNVIYIYDLMLYFFTSHKPKLWLYTFSVCSQNIYLIFIHCFYISCTRLNLCSYKTGFMFIHMWLMCKQHYLMFIQHWSYVHTTLILCSYNLDLMFTQLWSFRGWRLRSLTNRRDPCCSPLCASYSLYIQDQTKKVCFTFLKHVCYILV